ncbi:hypothetical protein AMS68_002770 [Peltaster fructicola]|uniref:Uncharacterized protein n=1 Tax=Peltaster fructicola TaxID=286661 RepID=A0A6H0XRC2_9PEZI|nr:hypothetical protein AMS68_002770 [Peltaster fructicola]
MPPLSIRQKHPANKLSNELIVLILEQVEPDSDKTVPVDRRQFLSVESFDCPPRSPRGRDIGLVRLASRRFAQLGAPFLFTRISGRLSKRGLQKLEQLAEWPHLTQHVRMFSYMVPYFYAKGDVPSQELLSQLKASFGSENVARFQAKVHEQRHILDASDDLRVLKKTVATFTSLQHVKLLRTQDDEDNALLQFIRQNAETRHLVHLEWAAACSHASKTIGTALLASKNVPWSRFSSPMLSPQSAEFLNWRRPASLSTLAERLTCLTLHFDDGIDMDAKMVELSSLFRTVFLAAKGMQAVHIGFPESSPLEIPLEAVFHNVTWDRLVAFGVQGWKLDTDEILGFARRHKERLKGLRLRRVLLNEGSLWKHVLTGLRESMHRLEWVSLRRIGYADQYEGDLHGVEVRDDLESESESDLEDYDPMVGPSSSNVHRHEGTVSDDERDTDTDSDDEHGPAAHDMDFPPLDSPVTPASAPWCSCDSEVDAIDDLEDDGTAISNTKRKAWEKWVVRRCFVHNG